MGQEISQLSCAIEEIKKARQASEKLTDTGELRRSRHYLHVQINEHFDNGELIDLIYSLGVDPEKIMGNTRNEKSLQFVFYAQRHGRMAELLERLAELRPLVEWKQ